MMRKVLLATAFMLMTLSTVEAATIELGESELYSMSEQTSAIEKILIEFERWEGCELHSLRYAGDQCNSQENINWLNQLAEPRGLEPTFDWCIEFVSDFHSPKEAYGAWAADSEYKDWQWWLARADGGEWHLLTWGY